MRITHTFFLLIMCSALIQSASAQSYSLETSPGDGFLQVVPGQVGTWEYTATNLSADRYLWITLIEPDPANLPFLDWDTTRFGFPVISPGSTFDSVLSVEDFASAEVASSAVVGSTYAGELKVRAFWYDGDPLKNGNLIEEAATIYKPYRISVTAVSEPTSMCSVGFGGICLWRSKLINKKN